LAGSAPSSGLGVGKIDDVIHGRLRLGVMAYLANAEVADFNELKAVLEVTQGNLSVQLRKLEDAKYVAIEKGYLGRRPRTQVWMTPAGRKAFAVYLEALGRLIGPQR
jgi:DNA-binding MarR family transcriptional regulator